MNRTDAAAYIGNRYAQLLDAAGVAWTDTPGALKEVLDDALRYLGYDEGELATVDTTRAETSGYLALLRYLALEKANQAVALKVDLTVGNDSKKASQASEAIQRLLGPARAEAKPFMETDEAFGIVRANLDIFEPDPLLTGS